LNHDPVPPATFNPELPPKLEEIIRTALEKDRDLRYQSAAEMRADLRRLKRDTTSRRMVAAGSPASGGVVRPSGVQRRSSSVAIEAVPPQRRSRLIPAVLGSVVLVALLAFGAYRLMQRPHGFNLQSMQFTKLTDNGKAAFVAISPNGQYVVYVLRDAEKQSLWVQNVATRSDVQVLAPDVVEFAGITFSPDGDHIYFVRSDKGTTHFRYLYEMPVLGGTPRQIIRDVDGAIDFAPGGAQFVFQRGFPDRNLVEVRNAQ